MAYKRLLGTVVFITLMALGLPAMANNGSIVYMAGDVKVNGEAVGKSYKVKAGDEITTGSRGKINIVMADKSVIDVQPNTKFQLEGFKFDKKAPEKSRSIMNLLEGTFRYISGLVGRTNYENATIKMGTATAGIRGSTGFFTFNGQTGDLSVDTVLGTTTLTLGGKTLTFTKGTNGKVNLNTGVSTSGSLGADSTAISNALQGLAKTPPETPTGLTGDELVLVMAAVIAEGDALGIDKKAMANITSAMLSQPGLSNEEKAGIAASAIKIAPDDVRDDVVKAVINTTGISGVGDDDQPIFDDGLTDEEIQNVIEQIDSSTSYNENDSSTFIP